jgi:antitoxin PrlF
MIQEVSMPSQAVRVQERGQVTIPLAIRRKLKLKKGDLVTFVETEEGVFIKPAEIVVADALNEIGKILKEKGITLEELIDSGREMRGQILEEKIGKNHSTQS